MNGPEYIRALNAGVMDLRRKRAHIDGFAPGTVAVGRIDFGMHGTCVLTLTCGHLWSWNKERDGEPKIGTIVDCIHCNHIKAFREIYGRDPLWWWEHSTRALDKEWHAAQGDRGVF